MPCPRWQRGFWTQENEAHGPWALGRDVVVMETAWRVEWSDLLAAEPLPQFFPAPPPWGFLSAHPAQQTLWKPEVWIMHTLPPWGLLEATFVCTVSQSAFRGPPLTQFLSQDLSFAFLPQSLLKHISPTSAATLASLRVWPPLVFPLSYSTYYTLWLPLPKPPQNMAYPVRDAALASYCPPPLRLASAALWVWFHWPFSWL